MICIWIVIRCTLAAVGRLTSYDRGVNFVRRGAARVIDDWRAGDEVALSNRSSASAGAHFHRVTRIGQLE